MRCGRGDVSHKNDGFYHKHNNGRRYDSCPVNDMLIRCALGVFLSVPLYIFLLLYCLCAYSRDRITNNTRSENDGCARASIRHSVIPVWRRRG